MCVNNISINATQEQVDLLGIFHTLLHTEERDLKTPIVMLSVQFLHRLYRMCSLSDGSRTKLIMSAIHEVLNQRYVIFLNYLKKNMSIENKLFTMSVFVVPVLLVDFFSMVVEVDEVVGGLLVLLVEVEGGLLLRLVEVQVVDEVVGGLLVLLVEVDGSQVEGVQV